MVEVVLAFLAGMLFNYWALGFAALVILGTTHFESYGWATLFGILLAVVLIGLFGVPEWKYVVYGALLYIPVGMLWSLWRWRGYCRQKIEDYDTDFEYLLSDDPDNIERLKNRYKEAMSITYGDNTLKATFWVVFWPFSALVTLFGDFIDFIHDYVVNGMVKLYNKISSQYTKRLD